MVEIKAAPNFRREWTKKTQIIVTSLNHWEQTQQWEFDFKMCSKKHYAHSKAIAKSKPKL